MVQICASATPPTRLEQLDRPCGKFLKLLQPALPGCWHCVRRYGFGATMHLRSGSWIPTQGKVPVKNIPSCSSCGDFQARRMQARLAETRETGKPELGAYPERIRGSRSAVYPGGDSGKTIQQADGQYYRTGSAAPLYGWVSRP